MFSLRILQGLCKLANLLCFKLWSLPLTKAGKHVVINNSSTKFHLLKVLFISALKFISGGSICQMSRPWALPQTSSSSKLHTTRSDSRLITAVHLIEWQPGHLTNSPSFFVCTTPMRFPQAETSGFQPKNWLPSLVHFSTLIIDFFSFSIFSTKLNIKD